MKIDQFVGKICTIITVGISRDYDAKAFYNYFMGKIESVDESGILLKQVNSNLKTFFFMHNIVGIAEEQVLDSSVPEQAQIINKVKSQINTQMLDKVDADVMTNIVQQMKKTNWGSTPRTS